MKKNIVKVLTNFSPFGAGPGLRRFARQEIWEAAVLHQRCESAESLQLRLLYEIRGNLIHLLNMRVGCSEVHSQVNGPTGGPTREMERIVYLLNLLACQMKCNR
jgi:hypothetical protein